MNYVYTQHTDTLFMEGLQFFSSTWIWIYWKNLIFTSIQMLMHLDNAIFEYLNSTRLEKWDFPNTRILIFKKITGHSGIIKNCSNQIYNTTWKPNVKFSRKKGQVSTIYLLPSTMSWKHLSNQRLLASSPIRRDCISLNVDCCNKPRRSEYS